MFLVMLMCLFSFACLMVSLLALGIVMRSHNRSELIETQSNELVIITGCDSGIGLELAKHVHATTKYTLMCGLMSLTPGNEGYDQLKKLASRDKEERLLLQMLDITSDDNILNLKETIGDLKRSKISKVVALVNNSGVMVYGEFDWLTKPQIQKQVDVNLVGTLKLTSTMVPFIIESKGRIINISSVNDSTVFPGLSVYSATKSAISTFSQGLGYELRKFGAHVVTFRLGDFARLTNIMSNHKAYRDEMWSGMDWKKKQLYGDYFKEFHDHLLRNFGMTSPKKFVNSNLFTDFSTALLSKRPPNKITCAPLPFKLFYFVIELLPIWIRYLMLDALIQFGFKWRPSSTEAHSGDQNTAATAKTTSTTTTTTMAKTATTMAKKSLDVKPTNGTVVRKSS